MDLSFSPSLRSRSHPVVCPKDVLSRWVSSAQGLDPHISKQNTNEFEISVLVCKGRARRIQNSRIISSKAGRQIRVAPLVSNHSRSTWLSNKVRMPLWRGAPCGSAVGSVLHRPAPHVCWGYVFPHHTAKHQRGCTRWSHWFYKSRHEMEGIIPVGNTAAVLLNHSPRGELHHCQRVRHPLQ